MLTTRRSVALCALLFLALVLALDLGSSATPNPYKQPAFLALGSGQKADGALCTAAPPS